MIHTSVNPNNFTLRKSRVHLFLHSRKITPKFAPIYKTDETIKSNERVHDGNGACA
jgi:hypothetical protein